MTLDAAGDDIIIPSGTKLDIDGSLDVDGNADITGDVDIEGTCEINGLTFTANQIASSGGILLLPNGSGDVTVGDGTDNDLNVKGDVVAFHSSDITLKENITRIPDALEKITSLTGNTYTWIEGHKYEGQNDTGVIAQEVEALGLPGITTVRDDGVKAVNYEKLVPLLIQAIKELDDKVNSLS